MNDKPDNSTAVIPDVPYRTVVLSLEKPFPDQGTVLTTRQGHNLNCILQVMADLGAIADEVKRNIYYGQQDRMSEAKMATLCGTLTSTIGKLIGPTQDAAGYRVSKKQIRLLHAALGLTTETAELAETSMNHVFKQEELNTVNFREELGDVRWYYELGCDVVGTSDEEVRQLNTKKLFTRYPGKFTLEAAVNRDLKAEGEALKNP